MDNSSEFVNLGIGSLGLFGSLSEKVGNFVLNVWIILWLCVLNCACFCSWKKFVVFGEGI